MIIIKPGVENIADHGTIGPRKCFMLAERKKERKKNGERKKRRKRKKRRERKKSRKRKACSTPFGSLLALYRNTTLVPEFAIRIVPLHP